MASIPPPTTVGADAGGIISVPTALTPYIITHTLIQPNPASTPTPLNRTITLPLCTPCQSAILPKSLLEHLRKQHHLPPELRGVLREFVASLARCNDSHGYITAEASRGREKEIDFGDVKCLNDGAGVVAGLRVVRGWRCRFPIIGEGEVVARKESEWDGGGVEKKKEKEKEKECGYIRRDVTDIRRHVNLVHGVGAKGMYEACVAQSWFGGRRAVYWRVGGCGGGDRGLDSAGGEDGVGCAGGDGNRDRGGDVVMSEAGNEEGQVRVGGEGSLDGDSTEKVELHEGEEGEGEELTNRLKTPVFTSLCRWGFYGKGFGDKTPKTWRVKDGKETEIERELRLGKIC